ncbi:hydroxysqualene dehydroxylase HpnE [Acidovorax sp. SUPP2825]|uniref:hydroxysqualene dehydroxylase HpnE n=1 Tax=Acidovorax sp. SUPP2825 TaxID=2920879 RepID=UPI0023DE67DF|nr:hydroxysqualene dehydroxylase HpnE [Acidovorax sp. SUPP2825]GKS93827.1 hydroxysqualene dehydroxylase HpnE [Acidovorax sp. SUPP2825]
MQRVAIIGGGWAGMAAAVAAAQAGHRVTVFEATRVLGGRARALPATDAPGAPGAPPPLDNGQHILIGAYTECLHLMAQVGVDPEAALLRLPLSLRFADGKGIRLPDIAPPWDAVWGIATARGWGLRQRLALMTTTARWMWGLGGFRCEPGDTVLTISQGLPPQLMAEFVEPLCVSALNTPAAEASATVFLRVLRDALFSGRGGSNLLLPRTDLGALFPEPAAQWLQAQGHTVHRARRVQAIAPQSPPSSGWTVDGEAFDTAVLALPSSDAARLVAACAGSEQAAPRKELCSALYDWAAVAQAMRFTAIATVYARVPGAQGPVLESPMLALRSSMQEPAQFAFDRGVLGGPPGLLALVVSAFEGDRAEREQQVLRQAMRQLGLPALDLVQTVVEKRATFACTPALQRPSNAIAPGLWACGDYVRGPYPATLEGAVLAGTAVGQQLGKK